MFFLGISFVSFSQQKSDFWDNVRFGGGFTLGFGSQTTVGISPSAIYDFNNGLAIGAGVGIDIVKSMILPLMYTVLVL